MKSSQFSIREVGGLEYSPPYTNPIPMNRDAGFLHMVSDRELHELRNALMDGKLPPDLQAKLLHLAGDGLIHRFIAQNSRLIVSLLLAAYGGSFHEAHEACLERLLRVLAYVRKNDDAIPDCTAGGFADDQQEMRAAITEFAGLLDSFKAWRLRYQVPEMWRT